MRENIAFCLLPALSSLYRQKDQFSLFAAFFAELKLSDNNRSVDAHKKDGDNNRWRNRSSFLRNEEEKKRENIPFFFSWLLFLILRQKLVPFSLLCSFFLEEVPE